MKLLNFLIIKLNLLLILQLLKFCHNMVTNILQWLLRLLFFTSFHFLIFRYKLYIDHANIPFLYSYFQYHHLKILNFFLKDLCFNIKFIHNFLKFQSYFNKKYIIFTNQITYDFILLFFDILIFFSTKSSHSNFRFVFITLLFLSFLYLYIITYY